jgi:hypothetical protein
MIIRAGGSTKTPLLSMEIFYSIYCEKLILTIPSLYTLLPAFSGGEVQGAYYILIFWYF